MAVKWFEQPRNHSARRKPIGYPCLLAKRFVCIHGHFYQPPRENPWLETVETQDSAAPYHDWNERICAECYAPNGAARMVNDKNQITRIVNNYARMSFNFGPTLLSWLKENAPRTYPHDSGRREPQPPALPRPQLGHGAGLQPHDSAAGQSRAIGITQIRWGIADYESSFGASPRACGCLRRRPTRRRSKLLAPNGIKFTVLAPHQCKRIRPLKERSRVDRHAERQRGHDSSVSRALRVGRIDRRLLLQRPGLARHRL